MKRLVIKNWRHFGIVLCAIVGATLLSVALLAVLIRLVYLFDEAPYLMILRPGSGRVVVQFKQRDRRLTTREIPVDIPLNAAYTVELVDDKLAIAGVDIDFYDSGPSPGCFRMHIGNTRLEITETGYTINGTLYGWERE
jgi:hypothetical protein